MAAVATARRLIGEDGRSELRSVTMGELHSKLDNRPFEVSSWEALRPLLAKFDLDFTVTNAELAKAQINMLRAQAERASPAAVTKLLIAVADAQSSLLTDLAKDLLRRVDLARLPRATVAKLARQDGLAASLDPSLRGSLFSVDGEALEDHCRRLASRLCKDTALLPKWCTIQQSNAPARRNAL